MHFRSVMHGLPGVIDKKKNSFDSHSCFSLFSNFIWFYMVLYGFIWFYMVVYGFIWFYMVLYGFICVSILDTHYQSEIAQKVHPSLIFLQ